METVVALHEVEDVRSLAGLAQAGRVFRGARNIGARISRSGWFETHAVIIETPDMETRQAALQARTRRRR